MTWWLDSMVKKDYTSTLYHRVCRQVADGYVRKLHYSNYPALCQDFLKTKYLLKYSWYYLPRAIKMTYAMVKSDSHPLQREKW